MARNLLATLLLMLIAFNTQAIDFTAFLTPEQALEIARRSNGGSLTPEQEQRILARFGQAAPVVPATVAAPMNVDTEDGLAAKIATLPPVVKGLKVEDKKDGFSVNGQPFMDSEGAISRYAFDLLSGEVTYLVETASNQFAVKFNRLGSDQDGLTIATAQRTGQSWQVQTATGKKMRGEQLVVLAKGLMLVRGAVAFKYVPSNGVQNISVPEGWTVANYQRGNVGATDMLLLEKVAVQTNTAGGMFDTFKSLGNTLSLNEDKNFALFKIKEAKLTEFAIASSGKTIPDPNGCRKTSMFINDCSGAQQIESLYDKNGDRNGLHYFWRLDWINTPQGSLAVALENLRKDVTLTDMQSGKKVVALNRTLGISRMDTTLGGDGKVKVVAQVGLEASTIDDAMDFLSKTPESKAPDGVAQK